MSDENIYSSDKNKIPAETVTVRFINPMLYDRLHTLSAEYAVSVEVLINASVQRLVDDVDFVRDLRMGKIKEF